MSVPPGRKTSSPLSSPTSSVARLSRDEQSIPPFDVEEGADFRSVTGTGARGEVGSEAEGQIEVEGETDIRSPATSSTLPLTDEESEEEDARDIAPMSFGGIRAPKYGDGDEESELTEEDEEEEEVEEIEDDDEDEEEDEQVEDGTEAPSISKQSIPSHSAASTGSLTPPPSDPLPTSPLPKVPLPAKQDNQTTDDPTEEDDEEDEGDEEGIEEGDVTMRAEEPESHETPRDDGDRAEGLDQEGQGEEQLEEGDGGEEVEVDEPEGDLEVDADAEADADADADADAEADGEGEQEGEADDDAETGAAAYLTVPSGKTGHSSHAPPPTTSSMRALLILELKFAALRDRLYIERMQEVAAEEEMIINGTHPALKYLYKTLSDRREKLHEVASRRHQQTVAELKRVREAEKNLVWSSWTNDRDGLHWHEFEQTWSKRRRLAREKNEIETPRIAKPLPRVGQPSSVRPFDWSAGATPVQLTRDEAANDLALMANRPIQLSRHASPAVYGQQNHAPQYNIASPSALPATSGANMYAGYPEVAAPQHVTTQHHVFAPTRTNPVQPPAQVQTQSQSTSALVQAAMSAQSPGSRMGQSQTQQPLQAQPRREGRTVPTTSDLFDGPRRIHTHAQIQTQPSASTKELKSPPIQGGANGSIVSHGLWGRQVSVGASDKIMNGHSSPLGGGSMTGSMTKDSTPPSIAPTSTPGLPDAPPAERGEEKRPVAPSMASIPPPPPSSAPPAAPAPTLSQTQAQHHQHRDDRHLPNRFASLADYLAGTTSTAGANGGLFPMGLGVGMGVGVGSKGVLSPSHGMPGRSPYSTASSNGNGATASPTSASGPGGAPTPAQPAPTPAGTEARS